MLAGSQSGPDVPVSLVVALGGAGVGALLAAVAMFTAESRCGQALLALQLGLDRRSPAAVVVAPR